MTKIDKRKFKEVPEPKCCGGTMQKKENLPSQACQSFSRSNSRFRKTFKVKYTHCTKFEVFQ